MEGKPFLENQLGEVLFSIENISRQEGGRFVIMVDCESTDFGNKLDTSTNCAVRFISNKEDEQAFEVLNSDDSCELINVSLAQEIVTSARSMKHDCTAGELVHCLLYYLTNDAFYIFD